MILTRAAFLYKTGRLVTSHTFNCAALQHCSYDPRHPVALPPCVLWHMDVSFLNLAAPSGAPLFVGSGAEISKISQKVRARHPWGALPPANATAAET
jgi:hypothetical protein